MFDVNNVLLIKVLYIGLEYVLRLWQVLYEIFLVFFVYVL